MATAYPTPSAAEIKYMQDNPTDGVLQNFENKYGPGSTFQYQAPMQMKMTPPKPQRRRRKPIAAGG